MLDLFNPWWFDKNIKPDLKGKKRKVSNHIINYIPKRQILVLKGLRRVGKTTVLFQLIDYLLTELKINPYNILYYSFDKKQDNIKSVINEYKRIVLKKDFSSDEKYYIFFDEIQKHPDWTEEIKIYYDLFPNIKFILTGSAALELLKNSKESLAGRVFYFKINPLDFKEYLDFKKVDIDTERIDLYKNILNIELENYFNNCGFIEMINETDNTILKKYFYESLLERVVYQDIPKTFNLNEPELLIKILEMLSYEPGIMADYKSIGNDLKRDQRTIANYFTYLKNTYLIKFLYNYSKNRITSEKKLKKVYIAYPCFIIQKIDKSYIFENLFVSFSDTEFFYHSPQKQEVDLVIVKDDEIKPIEIKYKSNIKKKDINGLSHFMKKYNIKEGILITKDFKKIDNYNFGTIKFIPGYEILMSELFNYFG